MGESWRAFSDLFFSFTKETAFQSLQAQPRRRKKRSGLHIGDFYSNLASTTRPKVGLIPRLRAPPGLRGFPRPAFTASLPGGFVLKQEHHIYRFTNVIFLILS